MKKVIRLFLILIVLSSVSQERLEQFNDTTTTKFNTSKEIEAFQPDVRLLNTSIWNRVTANRFECDFLRLAVELRTNEYWLLEMDNQKRLLAHHENYAVISQVITRLTLRSSPNWMEYEKLQEKEFDNYNYLKVLFLLYFGY